MSMRRNIPIYARNNLSEPSSNRDDVSAFRDPPSPAQSNLRKSEELVREAPIVQARDTGPINLIDQNAISQ